MFQLTYKLSVSLFKNIILMLELIVHPILDTEYVLEEIDQWLPRLHAVVIGKNCSSIFKQTKPALTSKLTFFERNVERDFVTLE